MCLVFVILLVLKEPARGQMDVQEVIEVDVDNKKTRFKTVGEEEKMEQIAATPYTEQFNCDKAIKVLYVPTNLLGFAQGIPGTVPWGAIMVYLNDYLAQNKGLGTETATWVLTAFNIGGLAGGLLGGVIGQKIYNWKKQSLPIFMGISTTAGVVPIIYLINAHDQYKRVGLVISFLVSFGGGILTAFSGANVRAILLNVNTPETRGTVFSIFNLMDDLGKGLGPFLVAAFVGKLGRSKALNLSIMFWVICGLFQLCIVFTVKRDVDIMGALLNRSKHLETEPSNVPVEIKKTDAQSPRRPSELTTLE